MIGTLTTYEILLMLDPEQAEARQDEIVARARETVEQGGGTWRSHDPWGRRRLAYEIGKKSEAVYHLVVFESEAATLDEISRVLKIDDAVLRHLATRHVEGSRTSAPPNDVPAPAATATAEVAETHEVEETPSEAAVSEADEPEYAPAEDESDVEDEEE